MNTTTNPGELAIKLHKALKAELEHHWEDWGYWHGIESATGEDSQGHIEYHAAAIARIAGYLGVE